MICPVRRSFLQPAAQAPDGEAGVVEQRVHVILDRPVLYFFAPLSAVEVTSPDPQAGLISQSSALLLV